MVLQKYKLDVILDLVFVILERYKLVKLITKMFK